MMLNYSFPSSLFEPKPNQTESNRSETKTPLLSAWISPSTDPEANAAPGAGSVALRGASPAAAEMEAHKNGGVGGGGGAPVILNVYDLTPINNYLYWVGLGIFHSGIEVHGMEYGFGAHDLPTSGVFEVDPKCCPGFVYRRSVRMGTTEMSKAEFRSFIEILAGKYSGNTYHLISKNCNHFTDDVCKNLTGKSNPGWVNRLARVGSLFNRLLPRSIQVSTVSHVQTHPAFSDDDMDSTSSSVIGDSDVDEPDQQLLPAASADRHSIDVPPKLAKDIL